MFRCDLTQLRIPKEGAEMCHARSIATGVGSPSCTLRAISIHHFTEGSRFFFRFVEETSFDN